MRRRLPTVDDVAKRAGVSTATVSRCLNEPDKVSETTRKKVLKAVDALGYAPNFGARAIAANRTGTFAAIIPTMENAIFARGIEAFQQTLAENNSTTLVASSAYDGEQEARLIRALVGKGADGILLIGTDRDPATYSFLEKRNIPYVIAWAISRNTKHSFVGFDNKQASRALVEHALSKGHQRIGYIAAKTRGNDRARKRVEGAKLAMKQASLEPSSIQLVQTDYSIESGAAAMHQLMESTERPTLVICGNDVLGVGAIQAAQELGMSVPRDVSVVGFDNIEMSRIISPALTTVDVPHREMGRLAAEALVSLVKTPARPVRTELETRIVERASLAGPPAN